MSKEVMKRIASELRYYNPLADKYKGEFIHKVWAAEIEEALAKQEQGEPAFYGFMDKNDCRVNICYTPWAAGGPNNELPTAYYTTPQQRTWVGLTDEDIYFVYMTAQPAIANETVKRVARAIEAKLKEKNT